MGAGLSVGPGPHNAGMWLLILEALAALALLLFFVWWTMFSGRRADGRPAEADDAAPPLPGSLPTAARPEPGSKPQPGAEPPRG